MRLIHSPTRSNGRALAAYSSTIDLTASVTSGQRGGLFGRYGIASLVNIGSVLALEILPPTQIETPSLMGSASGMAGQTVKQLPQYMHLSSSTLTVVLPSTEVGRMALFGQEATVVGISHCFGSASLSMRGGVRCRPLSLIH